MNETANPNDNFTTARLIVNGGSIPKFIEYVKKFLTTPVGKIIFNNSETNEPDIIPEIIAITNVQNFLLVIFIIYEVLPLQPIQCRNKNTLTIIRA